MADADYGEIARNAISEYQKLIHQKEELELQIAKKLQFLRAAINMLPEDEQDERMIELATSELQTVPLTASVREALRSSPNNKWFTATDVRDRLKHSGFDFSRYKANPLASIHAILKRLKPDEVETTTIEGVMAWRWKKKEEAISAQDKLKEMLINGKFKK